MLLGFFLVFSPHTLQANIHFGAAPTWSHFLLAIPVGMIAYTGIETVSNLVGGGARPGPEHPALDHDGRGRRLRDLLHAADDRALGDAGAPRRRPLPDAARRSAPRRAASRTTRCSGSSSTSASRGRCSSVLKIYVGLLAATILFIATNAGVIGASRITYAMAGYRQLPAVFRRLHPRFKTPWLSLIVFARHRLDPRAAAGEDELPRHDVLVRRDALVHGRARGGDPAAAAAAPTRSSRSSARPNFTWRGVDWPLFAIVGGARHRRCAWLDVVIQYPSTRYAGLGWLVFGFAVVRRLPAPHPARIARADGARAGRDRAGRRRSSTAASSCRSRRATSRRRRWTSPAASRPSGGPRSSRSR